MDPIDALLGFLAEAYPAFRPGDNTHAVWAAALGERSAEALRAATLEYVRAEKYPPNLASFLEYLDGYDLQIQIFATDNWERVILPRQRIGHEHVRVIRGSEHESHILARIAALGGSGLEMGAPQKPKELPA